MYDDDVMNECCVVVIKKYRSIFKLFRIPSHPSFHSHCSLYSINRVQYYKYCKVRTVKYVPGTAIFEFGTFWAFHSAMVLAKI